MKISMGENKKFNYNSSIAIYYRVIKEAFLPNLFKFFVAIVFMLIASSSIAYRAYLIKPAIDRVFLNKDIVALFFIPIQLVIVAFVSSFSTCAHKFLMQKTITNISIQYQKRLFNKLVHTDIDFYSNKSSHVIMSLFNDVSGLLNALNLVFTGVINEMFSIIGLICLMFYQSPKLAFLSLAGFPIVIAPFRILTKKLKRYAKRGMEIQGATNHVIGEAFSLIELVKSSASEDKEVKKFNRIAMRNFKMSMGMNLLSIISSPIMEMAGTIGFALVLWFGGKEVINETMTSGTFFTFITAALSIYKPTKSFSNIGQQIQTALLSSRRLFITLDKEDKIKDKEDAIILEKPINIINIENVYFKYPIHDKNEALITEDNEVKYSDKVALNHINLSFNKGESTALVGHSGSGKSTTFKLIQRFYDVMDGNINIDGVNIKDFTVKSLRKNISLVSQDILLFNASVKENIRYGNLKTTNEDIKNALEMANAMEFVNEMKDGMDSMLGPNGVILSGGQKQRISIARAILKNAPILLLDEATSSLDPISEKLIQNALQNLMKDKVTIIIAHRLSTVRNCDKIYVFKNGNIVENGKHDDLLDANGYYAELYKKQFESIK
ncbi:MAG: ABC transporter ATP-binding protein/permease, partial [Rickettsiales bacterium]|nr:ABC transporter ATP-binding protein/permease [Rickettsiales bacterium]